MALTISKKKLSNSCKRQTNVKNERLPEIDEILRLYSAIRRRNDEPAIFFYSCKFDLFSSNLGKIKISKHNHKPLSCHCSHPMFWLLLVRARILTKTTKKVNKKVSYLTIAIK